MINAFKLLKIALLMIALSNNVFAITPSAKLLINYETQANGAGIRSNQLVSIPHFEIPLNMVARDVTESFEKDFAKHMIFVRDGVRYVRWILNPEDTQWHLELQEHFSKKGLQLTKKEYFRGYQTASRSYIVEDPQQTIQFSVKSSTNTTGGQWSDKKQTAGDAFDSRLNAEFLSHIQSHLKFEYIIILDEPAILKIPAIDQAVVIRDLGSLNDQHSGKLLVPGFSVLHETTGRRLAKLGGSDDPLAYWTEHYIKAVARALGEFAARTGMQFDSPHSQNFLVELDATNFKPTGRIVFRDLSDLYADKNFIRAVHPNPHFYLEKFTQSKNILDKISAGFGPLHGNTVPSWVSSDAYRNWSNIFFLEFETSFAKVSGLSLSDFKFKEGGNSGRYFKNQYRVSGNSAAVQNFWKNMRFIGNPRGVLSCSKIWDF